MSTAVAVNDSSTGKTPLNKVIALGLAVFGVIEAVVAYFLVIGPLFVSPVFSQAAAYNEQGVTCIIKLFGKTFASDAEIASNQIILSLSNTILDIVLIYLIMTGAILLLAFCFYKGYAFAKTYLIAAFGAKAVIGLVPLLVPFANIRNTMRIFGIVDALICLAACAFFVYLNSLEYADDMLLTDEQIAAMKKRGIQGGALFVLLALTMIFESIAMSALGGNWSIYLGWLSETQLAQGAVLALLTAAGLVGAITYVRGADWAEFFFFSFGASVAVSNLIGIIMKVLWIFRTYKPYKALANQGDAAAIEWIGANGMTMSWWKSFIFLIAAFVFAAAITVAAFIKIKSKLSLKAASEDKKAVMAVLISVGSILLSFILTIVAVTMWDRLLYGALTLGAMDYMYFAVYGGITIFLVTAMVGGYDFTKFGALALYLIVASLNFQSIFTVFSARGGFIASNPGLVGYNYIIAGVLYILAFLSCFGIIAAFAVKDVSNYLYKKRYT